MILKRLYKINAILLALLAVVALKDCRIMPATTDGHGGIYTSDGNLWGYNDGKQKAGNALVIFNTMGTSDIYDDHIIAII